ncbi:MAG: hypothetical protein QHH15_08215 [Candidatus Thermoplasmatota archaeon]|jgi:hypothetical protein|nr:hypothetical protein [Candidatus Thermoplasmatota archaeon]
MRKIKTILIILIICVTFSIGTAAQSLFTILEKTSSINHETRKTNFEAKITIYVFNGVGCSCKPIVGAYVNATGSEGPLFNITDEDGKCVLNLTIYSEYRITIEAENYHTVMFNFDVVYDQTFKFHMGEANEDSMQNLQETQKIFYTQKYLLKTMQKSLIK